MRERHRGRALAGVNTQTKQPMGIPDRRDYGDTAQLRVDDIVPYVVQRHDALRRGLHSDVRLGRGRMLSWALSGSALPPAPGEKRVAAIQQPVHREAYAHFQGRLRGYGAGDVRTHDLGKVLIREVSPTKIKFVVAHRREPEEFTLVRIGGATSTSRAGVTKPMWYMVNSTPGARHRGEKIKYTAIPAEQIDRLFDPAYALSEKIDGASVFVELMKDKVHVLSTRRGASGRPIVHTYRARIPARTEIPADLRGSTFRGELWGERGGRAVSAQEIGAILNSTVANSLARDARLRIALYGVENTPGATRVFTTMPLAEQRAIIARALQALPKEVFHEPAYAASEEEKHKLWEDIQAGRNPRTREGVVARPIQGGRPLKATTSEEGDVFIREILPGTGRNAATVGRLGYSLTLDGPTVGYVSSGLDDDTRRWMWQNRENVVGRRARVRGKLQFESGAYRAPAFVALHEDYPTMKAAEVGAALADGIPTKLKCSDCRKPVWRCRCAGRLAQRRVSEGRCTECGRKVEECECDEKATRVGFKLAKHAAFDVASSVPAVGALQRLGLTDYRMPAHPDIPLRGAWTNVPATITRDFMSRRLMNLPGTSGIRDTLRSNVADNNDFYAALPAGLRAELDRAAHAQYEATRSANAGRPVDVVDMSQRAANTLIPGVISHRTAQRLNTEGGGYVAGVQHAVDKGYMARKLPGGRYEVTPPIKRTPAPTPKFKSVEERAAFQAASNKRRAP